MSIVRCPKCRFEFIAAERFDQPEVCPSCGEKFILAMAASAGLEGQPGQPGEQPGMAQPGILTAGGALAVTMVALLAVAADVLVAVGAVAAWMQSGARPAMALVADAILLVGLAGHAALGLWGVAALRSRRLHRSVLLMRLAMVCWLAICGSAIAMGARLWPVELNEEPLVLLGLAGGTFVALLAYLRVLEWLADRAGEESPAGPVSPIIPRVAAGLLAFNGLLTLMVGVAVIGTYRDRKLTAALISCAAFGAMMLYVLWTAIGLGSRISRPADAARLLPRGPAALLVALVLLAMLTGTPPATGRWAQILLIPLLIDLLAVWYCHRRLTPSDDSNKT